METSTFKKAIKARDHQLVAEGVKFNQAVGLTEREIYRYFALPAEPDMSFDEWNDIVKTALEKHP